MPALSQSLTFTVNSTSTVVLDYPNTGTTALIFSSDPIKGDGYFGASDGLHTVQISINNFVGKLEVQGTLEAEPEEIDWFPVRLGTGEYSMDTTGAIKETNVSYVQYNTRTSTVNSYNFTGNFVWVRARVSEWTEGTVNSIRINH